MATMAPLQPFPRWALVLIYAASVLIGHGALAGDLAPAGGAPAPSMKTLDEVEPRIPLTQETAPGDAQNVFRITEPGSYYLTENLVPGFGQNGIAVAASQVSIDGNGFAMATDTNAGSAVKIEGPFVGVSFRNANLRGWLGFAIDLNQGGDHLVADVSILDVASDAIRIAAGSVITNVTMSEVGRDGIIAGSSCIISDCILDTLGRDGMVIGSGSVIRSCLVTNANWRGIVALRGSSVSLCQIDLGGTFGGIVTQPDCLIQHCQVTSTIGDGVVLGANTTIRSSLISEAGARGLFVTVGCSVHRCVISNCIQTEVYVPGSFCTVSESVLESGAIRVDPILLLTSAQARSRIEQNLILGVSGDGGGTQTTAIQGGGLQTAYIDNHAVTSDVVFDLTTLNPSSNLLIGNSAMDYDAGIPFTFTATTSFGTIVDLNALVAPVQEGRFVNFQDP